MSKYNNIINIRDITILQEHQKKNPTDGSTIMSGLALKMAAPITALGRWRNVIRSFVTLRMRKPIFPTEYKGQGYKWQSTLRCALKPRGPVRNVDMK